MQWLLEKGVSASGPAHARVRTVHVCTRVTSRACTAWHSAGTHLDRVVECRLRWETCIEVESCESFDNNREHQGSLHCSSSRQHDG
jgi:hypothetical protein